MLDNGLKIKIPINKVGSVGLRDIIHEKEVKQVYSILKEKGHRGGLHHLESAPTPRK